MERKRLTNIKNACTKSLDLLQYIKFSPMKEKHKCGHTSLISSIFSLEIDKKNTGITLPFFFKTFDVIDTSSKWQ